MNHAGLKHLESQMRFGDGVKPIPEQYADMPNLWRVACELSKFKDPCGAANILLSMAGPALRQSKAREARS